MSLPDFDVFVAPDTAFAAFEEAVLAARCSVLGSFRIFDMRTPLVSASARAVGQTWFDLLLHVARRGVALDIVISDFDPVLGSEPHRLTWGSVKQGAELAERYEIQP